MAEAKPKVKKRPAAAAVPVVRDSTFHRALVDNALVFGVGNEVEIACLQAGPEIRSVEAQNEGAHLETVATLTEVVRLRMSWIAATTLAMNVLVNGIGNGALNRAAILEKLAELAVDGDHDEN